MKTIELSKKTTTENNQADIENKSRFTRRTLQTVNPWKACLRTDEMLLEKKTTVAV